MISLQTQAQSGVSFKGCYASLKPVKRSAKNKRLHKTKRIHFGHPNARLNEAGRRTPTLKLMNIAKVSTLKAPPVHGKTKPQSSAPCSPMLSLRRCVNAPAPARQEPPFRPQKRSQLVARMSRARRLCVQVYRKARRLRIVPYPISTR